MARNMPKGVEVAPLFQRFVAWLVDASVPAVLGLLMWALGQRIENPSVLIVTSIGLGLLQLAWGLLLWWGYGTRGAGTGFAVTRLQLVGIADGRPIGWWRYFLRQLVFFALMVTVVGGVFLVIFLIIHERHQGWHDLAARSVAIRARETTQPRRTGRSVAAPRRNSSTTVALPPHLGGNVFDGTLGQQPPRPLDPAELARQAAVFGGAQTGPSSGWRPPSAPGTAPEPQTGRGATAWPGIPAPDVGQTQVRRRRPLEDTEDDGRTHLARPAVARSGAEGWYLALDDGRLVDVTGLVVIGRKPTRPVGSADATLVPAGEDGHAVSKNHLQVGVDTRGVWVTDTGSTNGTAVVNARGDLEPCQPGLQVRVREGQVVSFGDRTLTVRRRPAF